MIKSYPTINGQWSIDIDFDYQPIHQSQKTAPSAQPARKITFE